MAERKAGKIKKIIIYFLSVVLFFIIWSIVAKKIDAPLILPSVSEVFVKIIELIKTKSFWEDFLYTFLRVIYAFSISLIAGSFLGIICGCSKSFKYFFDIPLSFIRGTPVVAIILVTLFWFNSSSVPVFVAVLMGLPIVVSSITEGFSKSEKDLLFMADIFRFSSWQKFLYIKLPGLKPFFINAAVSVFGLSWKVVVAGEVLSLPKRGFGSLMEMAQVHLETAEVIAITLILVTLSFSIEKLFSGIVKAVAKKRGKNEYN